MRIIDVLESDDQYIYRGMKFKPTEDMPSLITVKPDDTVYRNPKTTSVFIHNMVNALCYDKFGVYVRNLPFFYKDPRGTYYYGHTYRAKITPNMTFYYADGIYDFTVRYEAIRYGRIDHSKLIDFINIANNNVKMTPEFKYYFYEAIRDASFDIVLDEYAIKSSKDLENFYHDIGKRIFDTMIDNGYEYEQNRDMIIALVVNGLKEQLKPFYEYVKLLKRTKNLSEIPQDTEIMVDGNAVELSLIK